MKATSESPGLLRSSGVLGVASAAVRLCNVGMLAVLGRIEGAEAVGYYGLATVVASFAALGSSMGFPTFLTKAFASGEVTQHEVQRIHWLRFLGVLLGVLVATVISIIAIPRSFHLAFVLFAAAAMLDSWNETAWVLLRGTTKAPREALVNGSGYLVALVIAIPCYVGNVLSATGLAVIALSCAVGRSVLSLSTVGLRRNASLLKPVVAGLVKRSLPYWAADVLGLAYLRGDVLILAFFVSSTNLGHYVAAASVTNPLVQVAATMSFGALAVVSRQNTKASRGGVSNNRTDQTVLVFFAVSGLVVGGVLSLAFPLLIPLLFGVQYTAAILALAIVLALFLPVKFLNYGLQSVLLARGAPGAKVAILAGSVLLNALLNVWWAPSFGVVGAAWATLLTEAVVVVGFLTTGPVRAARPAVAVAVTGFAIGAASLAISSSTFSTNLIAIISGAILTITAFVAVAVGNRRTVNGRMDGHEELSVGLTGMERGDDR